jgi:predicted acyltransferase
MTKNTEAPAPLQPAISNATTASAEAAPQKSNRRWISLDLLRGATVALMILVNTAGDGKVSFDQLRHAAWNGCTLTDIVFPLFLFWMGLAMAISFAGRHARKIPNGTIVKQAARRAATIIALGLLFNALPFFHLASLRYCGVMQRIGLCYFLAAMLLLFLDARKLIVAVTVLLVGYWALLTLVPVPGYGGQNGIALGVLNPEANLASALDRILIPDANRYRHTFYDPEGILSTLPALATVLTGALAGLWLRHKQGRGLRAMAFAGAASMGLALLWNLVFPINKRMWTSSYVLWTAGIALLLLAAAKAWFDGDRPRSARPFGTPFLAFGSNALVAYMLSELLTILIDTIPVPNYVNLQKWSYALIPAWTAPAPLRSLLWSILFVGLCYIPVHILYRKKIFIKL